ncbi:AAA family ATPase [Actinocrispum wychmicini]|uniref:Dynein-related subfamily AAA family protein n=1 Tax=Actinocrispum wychmicini TaxID=1213861 RepID=A0A4V2S7B8_9PSEU|nr:MoxR family ATPase [Actinocrispum wychmicini]TCO59200.1 dynein-related subfamily AAA family protein [Actinocrispum wychmicini]
MSTDEQSAEVAAAQYSQRLDVPEWWVYRGTGHPLQDVQLDQVLPPPPPYRDFQGGPLPAREAPPHDDGETDRRLGAEIHVREYRADPHEIDMVNAALFLRRPLLVTGNPGVGKSSLAFRVARELRLGRVLRWPISSRTTYRSGLYHYDAIARAEAAGQKNAASLRGAEVAGDDSSIGEFIRLGPLGTAFLAGRLPRVLLIDELDKSEADLPNDLLSIFEDGDFRIPELERVRSRLPRVSVFTDDPGVEATVVDGHIGCRAFPFVVITSNGERDFPPAFLRRCLQLEISQPDADKLAAIVAGHMLDEQGEHKARLIHDFLARSAEVDGLPTDRLLDAIYLATSGAYQDNDTAWPRLLDSLWRRLSPVS